MNKKLVAVAIAGMLAAPLAQAQTANVQLYGRFNIDFEFINGKILPPGVTQPPTCNLTANTAATCKTINPNQYRVSNDSSRFGLRGVESLGGGIDVIFQVESGFNSDVGTGSLASRDTYLGFQGSWGRFRIGRFHAPYDTIGDIWGSLPTLTTGVLGTSSIWAQAWTSKATGGFDDRVCNSVRWDSPVMSGFQLQIQYGAAGSQANAQEGTTATQASNSGVWSGGLFYANGPLWIGTAMQYNEQIRNRGLNDTAWSIAASYQFPKVKVGAVYEYLNYDCSVPVAGNATTACNQITGGFKTDLKRNFYGVGVTVDIGPGQLYADYSRGADGTGSAPNTARIGGLAKGDSSAANQYSVTYTYPLSKRASLYGGWYKVANDANASYNFGASVYNTVIGGQPQGLVFGGWMNF